LAGIRLLLVDPCGIRLDRSEIMFAHTLHLSVSQLPSLYGKARMISPSLAPPSQGVFFSLTVY